MRWIGASVFFAVAAGSVAHATPIPPGSYLCTVDQRAGIGRTHLESHPGPEAFVDATPRYRFRISVSERGGRQRVDEAPYDGPERSNSEWHTPNSTLHAPYFGVDGDLHATEDQGFLRLGVQNPATGRLWFYHAAFEYPGGEDTVISVRYGTCERE
jgi:hypothetical protein